MQILVGFLKAVMEARGPGRHDSQCTQASIQREGRVKAFIRYSWSKNIDISCILSCELLEVVLPKQRMRKAWAPENKAPKTRQRPRESRLRLAGPRRPSVIPCGLRWRTGREGLGGTDPRKTGAGQLDVCCVWPRRQTIVFRGLS